MTPPGRARGGERSERRAGAPAADRALGVALLRLARGEIAQHLGAPVAEPVAHPALAEFGATFVTLLSEGELRGCIGSLEARRRLDDDVRENAVSAAFRDPRFVPLRRHELDALVVEVSLLGPSTPLRFAGEADLLAQLVPGQDGLILAFGGRRATFLPQVWGALPAPREFLAALKRKAGLSPDFWSSDLSVQRYAVAKWSETEAVDDEVAR
jgi:AmmeMemoRadiSam system protein A